MHRNLSFTFTSWPFLLSLTVLLLNDQWLKAAYPGLISGKLSDVSGIAVVALLLLTLLPRHWGLVYTGLAAMFAWWKSPLSQPSIDAINTLLPVVIGRTVDYTDLLALLVLPLCRKVTVHPVSYMMPMPNVRRMMLPPIVGVTIFALMATSILQTRHEYVVRKIDPTAELSKESVNQAIAEIVAKHGLVCLTCTDLQTSVKYSGNGIDVSYSFPTNNSILFKINAVPTGIFFGASGQEKAERLRSDLKDTLASRFNGLEYVEKLDRQ